MRASPDDEVEFFVEGKKGLDLLRVPFRDRLVHGVDDRIPDPEFRQGENIEDVGKEPVDPEVFDRQKADKEGADNKLEQHFQKKRDCPEKGIPYRITHPRLCVDHIFNACRTAFSRRSPRTG